MPKTRLHSCSDKTFLLALALCAVPALFGCSKPAPQPAAQPGPAASAAPSPSPTPSATQDLSAVAVEILNKAQRSGGVVLRGVCGPQGIADQYTLPASVPREPMNKALQEVSGRHQNIYWRESPATGVRIADSSATGKLLAVHVREFRVVEDREPDRVMQILWHTPEVAAFLRRNHLRFARRSDGERKALSPPMIVEVKNRTVAEILDRIAAGYRQSPPRVWVYQECGEKEVSKVDVRMR